MNREVLLLVDALGREKNVEKEIVFGALELALASATKKRFQEDVDVRASVDRTTGEFSFFRRWQVMNEGEVVEPARQIVLGEAKIAEPRHPVERVHRETAGRAGSRAHRRADGEAGDSAEDPRCRARADPQRLLVPQGISRHRRDQAHGARQCHHRVGASGSHAAARSDDSEGELAHGGPRAGLRVEDRPLQPRTAAYSVAHRARVPGEAVRARSARARGRAARNQGGGARSRLEGKDRRAIEGPADRPDRHLRRHARLAGAGSDLGACGRARRHHPVGRRSRAVRDQRACACGSQQDQGG